MTSDPFLHSRKLMLLRNPSTSPPPPEQPYNPAGDNSFDANVVMVLSVLLCALICSLGLNSVIRCALRCSSLVADASSAPSPGGGGGPSRPSRSATAGVGIKKKALKTFPTLSYSISDHASLPGLGSDCAICLAEFSAGDRVRLLPKCHHGFHVRCIDKWLNSHSSCPKCRHNLLETFQKIVGGGETATPSSSELPFPVAAVREPLTLVNISPLHHEGPIRSYRGNIW